MRRTASGICQAVGTDRPRRRIVDPDAEIHIGADPADLVRAGGVDLPVFAGNDGCRKRAIQMPVADNSSDLISTEGRGRKPVDLPNPPSSGYGDFSKRVADVDEQNAAHGRTISVAAAKVKPQDSAILSCRAPHAACQMMD